MKKNRPLDDKLKTSLTAIDKLIQNIRQTQDYSEKSEIIFLLREFISEQIETGDCTSENSHSSASAPR